jgi:formate/nitrite transporter
MRAFRGVISLSLKTQRLRQQLPAAPISSYFSCLKPPHSTLDSFFPLQRSAIGHKGAPSSGLRKLFSGVSHRQYSSRPTPLPLETHAAAAAPKTIEPELMVPPPNAFDNLRNSIISRSTRPTLRIFASAILAGSLLATSCSVVIAVVGGFPAAIGIQKLMAGLLFPAGLSMILFLQADLLTSQMAHLALPRIMASGDVAAIARADVVLPPAHATKLLSIVFAGNFVGSLAVAAAVAPLLFSALPFSAYAAAAAVAKTSLPWAVAFAKGIGANYLVNVAVFMAACAKTPGGKMVSLWLPIMSFVALGLEHSVANMFIIPVGIFCGADVAFADFLVNNLVPVTLGNLFGGLLFASHALLHPLPPVVNGNMKP